MSKENKEETITLELKRGKHHEVDENGQSVCRKPGDMVKLTKTQAKNFGSKFGPKTVVEKPVVEDGGAQAPTKEEKTQEAEKALKDAQKEANDAQGADAKKAASDKVANAKAALAEAQKAEE